jgi:hypothetical protein
VGFRTVPPFPFWTLYNCVDEGIRLKERRSQHVSFYPDQVISNLYNEIVEGHLLPSASLKLKRLTDSIVGTIWFSSETLVRTQILDEVFPLKNGPVLRAAEQTSVWISNDSLKKVRNERKLRNASLSLPVTEFEREKKNSTKGKSNYCCFHFMISCVFGAGRNVEGDRFLVVRNVKNEF